MTRNKSFKNRSILYLATTLEVRTKCSEGEQKGGGLLRCLPHCSNSVLSCVSVGCATIILFLTRSQLQRLLNREGNGCFTTEIRMNILGYSLTLHDQIGFRRVDRSVFKCVKCDCSTCVLMIVGMKCLGRSRNE